MTPKPSLDFGAPGLEMLAWPWRAGMLWLEYWQRAWLQLLAPGAARGAASPSLAPFAPWPAPFPMEWMPRVDARLDPLPGSDPAAPDAWRLSMRLLFPGLAWLEQQAESVRVEAVIRHDREEAPPALPDKAGGGPTPLPRKAPRRRPQGES